MKPRFTKTYLRALRKEKLFSLCLSHFGYDTACIYQYYTKEEMISDLLTVTK